VAADPTEPEPLSERQQALLEGLRAAERSEAPVDIDALAEATGYTASSIRTYFTKKLEGVLVFRDGGEWRVRGAIRCMPEAFARRMSQKAGTAGEALRSQEAWRSVLRKLLYEGQRRHYRLGREERELMVELIGDETPPGPSPPAVQASLFRKD
jgi:hypothetical protein